MQHAMRYILARACTHALTDLRGFGFEHAGVAARDMIGRVMSVSMANYPEQMHTCYLVNVPWVFFALWRALTPMMSPRTVDKVSTNANNGAWLMCRVLAHTTILHEQHCARTRAMCACVQVLDANYMAVITERVPLYRLPTALGGAANPIAATTEQFEALLQHGVLVTELKGVLSRSSSSTAVQQRSSTTAAARNDDSGKLSDRSGGNNSDVDNTANNLDNAASNSINSDSDNSDSNNSSSDDE
eukprot:13937-Heterococcus_DN1.PRE.3